MDRLRSVARFVGFVLTATRCLPAAVSVTITSNPAGMVFTVTGGGCSSGGYATPQALNWTPGASCTVTFVSPQSAQIGTQYVFTGWQDGSTANPRTIVTPGQASTYTGNFKVHYLLSTDANPPQGGSVAGGGWYESGSTKSQVTRPVRGYHLVSSAGTTASTPASVVMGSPQAATANFSSTIGASPTPNNYTVSKIVASTGTVDSGTAINNFGQVAGSATTSNARSPFIWTPTSANSSAGNLTNLAGLNGPFNTASSINSRGQVVGTTTSQFGLRSAFLWSPASPNGNSSPVVTLLGSSGPGVANESSGIAVNDYGQVIGSSSGGGFLWTPTVANATIGTVDGDPRLTGAVGINDYGQVIINSLIVSQTNTYPFMQFDVLPILFTPSQPNAQSGVFTQVYGLPGFGAATLLAINNGGAIVGVSCALFLVGQCIDRHLFVWTPTLPNGSIGTVTTIVPPTGFEPITPAAMNAGGQVVGTMIQANLSTTSHAPVLPFLYTGGSVYDLSTVDDQLNTGLPAAINDHGQILVNVSQGGTTEVYLLTPAAQAPTPVSVNPPSGTGQSQIMTFTFTDPRGWQDLDVENILINNFLDGRNACYLAYSRSAGVLYLVPDAGGGLLPALTLGGSGSTSNSQCSIAGAGSSATGSGNTLTLALNITFAAAFGGNKIVYMAARDVAADNSGWQPLGVWNVPGAPQTTTTAVVGMAPASGNGVGPVPFTFTFSDTQGIQDLGVQNILVNGALDGRGACYLAYARPYNVLFLMNDAGTALLPGQSVTAAGTLSNSQCTVSWGANPVITTGNTLTLNLNISFSAAFDGNRIFFLASRDLTDANNSGWQAMGTWAVR